MKIAMFIVMFLMIGAFFIVSNENIKLNNKENVKLVLDKYTHWLDRLGANAGTVSGYVLKMEWLPENG